MLWSMIRFNSRKMLMMLDANSEAATSSLYFSESLYPAKLEML